MKIIKIFKFLFLLLISIISFNFKNNIFADYNFGGRLIYDEQNNNGGYVYYYDIDSNINIRTNSIGNSVSIYKNIGEVYNKYNSSHGFKSTYYKAFNSLNEKQILPNNANFVKFSKTTGDYIYLYKNNEENYYKNNINSTGSGILILSGKNIGIDAISSDFNKIIYHKNDLDSGNKIQYLKELKTGNEAKLGLINENSGSVSISYKYNFIINSNKILKTTSSYNNDKNTTSINYEYLNITVINNIIKSNANFNFGDNSKFIGAFGNNLFYELDNNLGEKVFYKKTGTITTKILVGNYEFLTDTENSSILKYNNSIIYKYDDSRLGKKVIGFLNLNDFSTGTLFKGNIDYNNIYLTTKTTKAFSHCINIEGCGQPVLNYTDLQNFDDKQYSNELGFIGNKFTYTGSNYSNDASLGFLGNKFTYTYTGIAYGNDASLGFLGNKFTYTGSFLASSESAIGFLGTKYNYVEPKVDYHIGNIGRYGSLPVVPQVITYTNESPIGFIGMQNISNYLPFQDKLVYENSNTPLDDLKYNLNRYLSKSSEVLDDIGDPVNLYSGEFSYVNTILKTKGNFPYSLDLYYSNQVQYSGIVGNNFDFSCYKFLSPDENGNITYFNGRLGNYKFTKNSDGNFSYNKDIKGYLEVDDEGNYLLTLDNKTLLYFNSDLRVSKIQDLHNNYFTFDYDFDGKLLKTTTSLGEVIKYEYYQNNRLFKVTGPNNYSVVFEYYSDGENGGNQYDLKSLIITKNGKIKTNKFTYTKANNNVDAHNMVKLIDAGGQTYVENTYQNDRVISQKYGDGTISYNYVTDENNKVIQNTVINRNNIKTVYNYNSFGLVIKRSVVLAENNSINYSYEYDGSGNVLKEIYPKGNGYAYKYDENGNLIEKRFKKDIDAIFSYDDLVYTYTYDEFFNLVDSVTKPDGTKINYTYDDVGNISGKYIYEVNNGTDSKNDLVTSYEYDENGNIVLYKDESDGETKFIYNEKNELISKITGTGTLSQKEDFVYDNAGNIIKKIDSLGNETLLSYDEYNLIKYITTPEGTKTYYTYDNLGNKTSEKLILDDTNYVNKEYTYDILDNVTQTKLDLTTNKSKINISTYDGNGNISSITDDNGLKTTFEYNYDNKISKKLVYNAKNILVRSFNYAYDQNGNLTKSIDDKNISIDYEYDLYDRLIKVKDSKTKTTREFTYDKVGNKTISKLYNSKEELLKKIEFSYNEIGNILETKESIIKNDSISAINTTKFSYNKSGNVTNIVYPDGNTTKNTYDDLKRLISQTDKYGKVTDFVYDKRNLLLQKTIHNENSTQVFSYEYDKDARLVKQTNPANKSKFYSYNKLNQITKVINELGVESSFSYDYVGNITKKVEKIGNINQTTDYEYDINNNLIKLVDAKGNITNYIYDEFSRLIKETKSDNTEIVYEYDNHDNLVSKINPDKTQIKYSYDTLNRLIKKDIVYTNTSDGKVTSEEYEYDDLGRIIKTKDNFGNTLGFTYDNDGKILSEKQNDREINYEYDNLGNIILKKYPNGDLLSYIYDDKKRVIQIKNGTESLVSYTYNKDNLLSESLQNGVVTNYTYDELQRRKSQVTSKDNIELKNYKYTYNDVSNIIDDGYDKYTYDDLQRIIGVEYKNNSKQSFIFDELGNRSSSSKITSQGEKIVNYTTNNLNQYTKTSSGVLDINYTYDLNGNLIQDSKNNYEYDYKNRLVRTTPILSDEEIKDEIIYNYDILGRRISKETKDKKITYIYSNSDVISEKIVSKINGSIFNKSYFYGKNGEDDIVSEEIESSGSVEKYFYTKNAQNSVVLLTDINGVVKEKYIYDVFGKAYKKVNFLSITSNTTTLPDIESIGNIENTGSVTSSGIIENTGSIENLTGVINTETGITESDSGTTHQIETGIIENVEVPVLSSLKEIPQPITETNSGVTENTGSVTGSGSIDNTGSIESSSGVIQTESGTTETNSGTIRSNSGITGNTGSVTENNYNNYIEYDGEYYEEVSQTTDNINSRLFTAREYESETGLYYYRARYYSPDLGRFISRDPIDISDNINLYAYVGNNPVMYNDPSGLYAKQSRNGLDESTRVRIDGSGKIILGGLETLGGATAITGGAALCTGGTAGTAGVGAVPACVGGGVAITYGSNYLVSGSTKVGGGIHQLISGERNDVYFNAGHKLIDASTENKNTADNVKLALDVADIGVGVSKGIYSGGKFVLSKLGKNKNVEEKVLDNMDDITFLINNADSLKTEEILAKATKGEVDEFYQQANIIQKNVEKSNPYAKDSVDLLGFGWSKIKTNAVDNYPKVFNYIKYNWHGGHEVHHIIPANFVNNQSDLIKELDKIFGGKFDINGAYNGVFLPSKLHGNHFDDYDKLIKRKLENAITDGYSKEQVISMLSDVRKTMLEGGQNNPYALITARKTTSNDSVLFQDMRNTINLYK